MTAASEDAPDTQKLLEIADDLVRRALAAGADAAEAMAGEDRSLDLSVRDGKLDDIGRSESLDAGLRVFAGGRQAGVGFSDLSEAGRQAAVERAVAMARAAPEDRYAGLADPEQLLSDPPVIPLYEDAIWGPEELERLALECEAAARAVDGVTQTDSAFASFGVSAEAHVASNGLSAAWRESDFGYGASVIAGANGAMERDWSQSAARRRADLRSAGEIGREAGERAAARLNPKKLKSGRTPVVFDRRVATAFLSALTGAVSGPAVARGVSFLRDAMGERVFAKGVNIVDDPHRPWGHASAPMDGEGLPAHRRALIEDGRLTTWLLNLAAARQLGLAPTGHARGASGGPPGAGPYNLHLEPGPDSREAMIGAIAEGLLVTEMFGPSLNPNTGDWSVGVSGFRIVRGTLAHPVSEVTVAGNLKDIFARLVPADDLKFRGAKNSPSVHVDALSVGGV